MFAASTIRKRVMQTIDARINKAEEQYVAQCEAIDNESFAKKEQAADNLVSQILKD